MFVIGTAGHVDHGKSTLVHALTGINPDRLQEEQERQMTIDLGFAWLTLPSGREVSIVDVPGHEDFIKNMLAGIGGIDVALFVVAADEGVMPQTREHLAILDLLRIPKGVVALTKSDLVEDQDWLDLVQEEVREELEGTALEAATIIPVSAVNGSGLPDLLSELDRLLDGAELPRDMGKPRLPIDRAFSISGFGTVVTGTLLDGRFRVGDEVLIVPGDVPARIRGLQSHKSKLQEALPGSRLAINLTGVTVDALERGQVVTRPGGLCPTMLLDAQFRLLRVAPFPLKHNALVDFYCAAARAAAHLRLLDAEILEPGQTGWVQFRLEEPIAVDRGDRYIVRLASPSLTLGGGQVVEARPGRRHKRFRPSLLAHLETLHRGTPEELLLQLLYGEVVLSARDLVEASALPPEEAVPALTALIASNQVVVLADTPPDPSLLAKSALGLLSRDGWEALLIRFEETLRAYHERYPLRVGMPREELKSRVRVPGVFFNAAVARAVRDNRLAAAANAISAVEHTVSLSTKQRSQVEAMLAAFRANPFVPPSLTQVEEELGPELLQFLLEDGSLVKVSDGVLFDADTYVEMKRRLIAHLREHESVTVAQVRDLFGTSRRYALGFLEEMDRSRVTKRLGDLRVLR